MQYGCNGWMQGYVLCQLFGVVLYVMVVGYVYLVYVGVWWIVVVGLCDVIYLVFEVLFVVEG